MTGYGGVDHIVKDALYERYFDTVGGEQVYRMDENNPIVSELMSQNDGQFADLEYMQKYGCNFMATIAYPQMLKGELFKADQIKSIWSEAGANSSILNITADKEFGEGSVANPDRLAQIALQRLGLASGSYSGGTGMLLSFGHEPFAGMNLIGNKLEIPKKHFLAGDLWSNVIFNAGNMVSDRYLSVPVWATYLEGE